MNPTGPRAPVRPHESAYAGFHPVRSFVSLARTWRGRFILAFITVQLCLPLHYYLVRRDPHDERYAWRMFSPMRMAQCSPQILIDKQPVQLTSKFHEAWIEIAQRGRFVVLEAMAAKVCEENPGKSVEISLDCTYVEGIKKHYGGQNMCQHPKL